MDDYDIRYSRWAEKYWTPCKHYSMCIGFCPLCMTEAVVNGTFEPPPRRGKDDSAETKKKT